MWTKVVKVFNNLLRFTSLNAVAIKLCKCGKMIQRPQDERNFWPVRCLYLIFRHSFRDKFWRPKPIHRHANYPKTIPTWEMLIKTFTDKSSNQPEITFSRAFRPISPKQLLNLSVSLNKLCTHIWLIMSSPFIFISNFTVPCFNLSGHNKNWINFCNY